MDTVLGEFSAKIEPVPAHVLAHVLARVPTHVPARVPAVVRPST
jgi:hypothetical protein